MDRKIWIALCLALLLIACSPAVPKKWLLQLDATVTPEALRKTPERYVGKTVLLGGMILKTTVKKEETLVEVLHQPLDSVRIPMGTDKNLGRFIIRFKGFMDPAIFTTGRKITLVGEITGTETLPMNGIHYTYPVISPKEYHLWTPDELRPYISFQRAHPASFIDARFAQ